MSHSTLAALLLATPFSANFSFLAHIIQHQLLQLDQLLVAFCSTPPTPASSADFEHQLRDLVLRLGRDVLEQTFNHLEPEQPQQALKRVAVAGEVYRCRGKTPNTIATLFGPITLRRSIYEPLQPGERCLHPLEIHLGIVAANATAALAERVGRLAAQHSQRETMGILEKENGIHWTHKTLRNVVSEQAQSVDAHRQATQVERLLVWLTQAEKSKGRHLPVLAVGRDGITVLLTEGKHEASTATVSVFDRKGKRLGTVYLGQMPEEQQVNLSQQLTDLVTAVLMDWRGRRPRLAYVTDGGWHPTDYFRRVLRRMVDPHAPQKRLQWQRVIDFYHAMKYVNELSEALFGATPQAREWTRRMRHLLKEPGGAKRLLQSAGYHRHKRKTPDGKRSAYAKAYGYLRRNRRYMDYAGYRRVGVPMGSGVTEAACKIVFTQRLKQSGMRWTCVGGQRILSLRVLHLSGVYAQACRAHRARLSTQLHETSAIFSSTWSRLAG